MLRNETITTLSDELRTVNNICLHAARSNAYIMLELAKSGKLGEIFLFLPRGPIYE